MSSSDAAENSVGDERIERRIDDNLQEYEYQKGRIVRAHETVFSGIVIKHLPRPKDRNLTPTV
jgi:hypothetical protein